jgi:predicted double-glycine peptidase
MLVILQQGVWMNHCVAVLNTTDKTVVFADPAEGIITLSQKHFHQLWTGRGILLQDLAAK